MSVDVGKRLQAVRTLNGWSQRELAKRAGVTNSTISVIEQGRVSPSVSSLKKVLDGIPMSLADFFNLDFEQSPQTFFTAAEMPNVGGGEINLQLLGSSKRNRRMTLTRGCYPPGADTGEERLSCEGEVAGLVVAGELEVSVGSETQVLKPDEGFYFEGHRPHRFRNLGTVDCLVITVHTPATV